jgi:hypothetical protein
MMPGAYLIDGELYVNNEERAEMWVLNYLCEEQHKESMRLANQYGVLSNVVKKTLRMPPRVKNMMVNYLNLEPVKWVEELNSNKTYNKYLEERNRKLAEEEDKNRMFKNAPRKNQFVAMIDSPYMSGCSKPTIMDRFWSGLFGFGI